MRSGRTKDCQQIENIRCRTVTVILSAAKNPDPAFTDFPFYGILHCARNDISDLLIIMNLLFVCSKNRLRSPTGEKVFSEYEGIDAIGCGTDSDADLRVSADLIEWADIVFVMEKSHRNKVSKKFGSLMKHKKLVCLDIPDNFERMDPLLVRVLKSRVFKHIRIG